LGESKVKSGLTQPLSLRFGDASRRAPDGWESARFQAFCLASSWFRQSGFISSRPPAGNANR
jgi:hypothetical protein